MTARFSIGIDLGTTNSALAYAPLSGDAAPDCLPVAQWESPATLVEAATLPSFLYFPDEALAAQLRGRVPGTEGWIVGRLARRRAGETPGRVVRSAKSWLCHHTADRSAPILPWGSDELTPAQKISPVRAAAFILNYLRGTWDARFAGFPFDDQDVTITVPASFDAAAQQVTLTAAAEAGFGGTVRLLEEPQAAFYCWLERHSAAEPLFQGPAASGSRHVLIVDIGGGTSDFSLFEVRSRPVGAIPAITRVAVSDHILLGGDNVDLALAGLLEPRLAGERGQISGLQWEHLVASCRDLKEQVLAEAGSAQERFSVTLPNRGSSLVAGAQTATVGRDEIERLVLDGFFPACDARARPYRTQAGLRDWGLPYATDSAVTHHLADFLRDRPRVDAVLFNGGSLHAAALRRRLLEQIAAWQGGAQPIELENAEPALAVARGAARYGKLLQGEAGEANAPVVVCVLPRNAPVEQVFDIDLPGLEVRTDHLVSFQACSSTHHGRCRAGDVLAWDAEAFHTLPPLQTIIRTADGVERSVPVRLAAKMNALGLLQISCASVDPGRPQSWPLEFNLRPLEQGRADLLAGMASAGVEPNASSEAQQAARDHLTARFTRLPPKSDKLTANAVLKRLEGIIGLPRYEWNAALLRALWPALNERTTGRKLSVEHEEAWLTLAGFLLRPGFGFAQDGIRMDALWRLRDAKLCFPGKRGKVQECILWRRVAGGLSAERQEMLLAGERDVIRSGRASPELVRMAGSLERLGGETKAALIEAFIEQVLQRIEMKQHCAPYLAALGGLLSRAPLYGGPETVVAPAFVARAYAAFEVFDWAEPELLEMHPLFLRAARVVDDRNLDVPKSLRDQIARKLENAGVAPLRTATIKAFMPVGRSDGAALWGEALPAGLVLGAGVE
jgi:molecular chaperone DnaK (HSP70)